MGFFKSMRDLQRQGNEISKNRDVGAQLDDAGSAVGIAVGVEIANSVL